MANILDQVRKGFSSLRKEEKLSIVIEEMVNGDITLKDILECYEHYLKVKNDIENQKFDGARKHLINIWCTRGKERISAMRESMRYLLRLGVVNMNEDIIANTKLGR